MTIAVLHNNLRNGESHYHAETEQNLQVIMMRYHFNHDFCFYKHLLHNSQVMNEDPYKAISSKEVALSKIKIVRDIVISNGPIIRTTKNRSVTVKVFTPPPPCDSYYCFWSYEIK